MDLVEIGQRLILLRQRHDLRQRGEVTVHGIQRLEGDQLWPRRIGGLQQFGKVCHVVVAEDLFSALL